jgi:aarF domain-containing kinase
VEETFAFFDPIPLGSASIGQVHRAILKDGTREVAVKVQYPEAQHLFRKDITTIRAFCEALAPEHVVILDALEKQNASELDYQNEANNLLEVAANMKRHGFRREVTVPAPIPELTTRRMLIMELLPGPKLIDGVRAYFSIWAEQNDTTLHDLEKEARQRIEKEGIPKYSGPSAFSVDAYRHYLALRNSIVNLGIATYNGTAGWIKPSLKYYDPSLPPNIPIIVDTLMRVHGYQLLADGVFNSGE